MNYSKEILVKDYFDIHDFYSNIYGINRTIILMQVGSFHECYSTDDNGIDLISLATNLDIICTKKDSKKPISKSNPRMVGFPIGVIENFIEKLCNLNYTIVLINQTSEPPKPKREVVGVYSPATFINNKTNASNAILSVVLDKISTNKLCIGLSSYDILTGYGSFYELYSDDTNIMFTLDDAIRYLESLNAKEILIQNNLKDLIIQNMNYRDIINYLGFNENTIFTLDYKNTTKVAYQKIIFEQIFINQKNIFDLTNLDKYNWARLSLTNLFEYLKNHQELLISSLKLPKQFINDNYLYLGNHALDQLDILPTSTNNKSLFNIINYTKTLIGKRFLKTQLTKPLVNIDDLNKRFNLIEKLLENNICYTLQNLLEDISDTEKLIRRLELNILHPFELNQLYISFYQIKNIINFSNKYNIFNIKKTVYEIDNFLNYITNKFNLNKIADLNFNNFYEYDDNIFVDNIEITNIYKKIEISKLFMCKLQEKLSDIIEDKKKDSLIITLKYNDRDGHHFIITNRRCELLKNKLLELKEIEIEGIILSYTDLIYSPQPKSTYTKINCKKIKELSTSVIEHKIELAKLTKKYFEIELKNIINNYLDILLYFSKTIGFIDFINSGAICSLKNHYTKPKITYDETSYFKADDLRHPIVEYINNEYEYKPHNISLGGPSELTGILLYGINSSGKSTLMKSIGLNIILAQIGYFTSSKNFEFSPYKSLFTRISGNDNIYRGLSSFMVEMIELTSILKRNNKNTLVLGDEICKGTEEKSANIIVAYMLKTLSENKCSFITATHLHKLGNLDIVKNLLNVKSKHLKITYDKENDKLIFDRQLSDGQGESFYGLTVAKFLMKDTNFNHLTSEILKDYDNYDIKKSKYNSNNYLFNCEICKTKDKLETHHINFQKNFDKNKINKDDLHIQKDANYNLVTLCTFCHDEVDRNKLIIYGWEDTINGKNLIYDNNTKIKKKKYSDEFIEFVKSVKDKTTDTKFAQILIKENYDIKMALKTIETIWQI